MLFYKTKFINRNDFKDLYGSIGVEYISFIKRLTLIVIFVLILPISLAQSVIDFNKIDQTAQILEKEFKELESANDPNDVALVVEGEKLNGIELILIDYLKKKYPYIAKVRPKSDEEVNLNDLLNTNKMVVLLGGHSQNKITSQIIEKYILKEKEHPSKTILLIYEGKNNAGSKILVVSDRRGFNNVARLGPERSPLRKFMPPAAVVAVASFLSVLLASLWQRISGPIRVILAKVVTGLRKKKVRVQAEAKYFTIGKFSMKYREIIAIIIGAFIYALAVTLAVTGLGIPILEVLKISVIGSLIFFVVREIGRIFMCFYMELHTEYLFWFPGAIFSVLTGYLGNTLNTPGFVVEHKDKEILFNKYSRVKYFIVLGTFIISFIFFILNILFPSISFQLFAIISSTYAATEIIPFKPCPGKDIMKWRPILWGITLIIVFSSYIMFNFVI